MSDFSPQQWAPMDAETAERGRMLRDRMLYTPSTVGETGYMVVRVVDGALVVDRADERILIAEELVGATGPVNQCVSFVDDVMTVAASNGTWRYRLIEHDRHRRHYLAEKIDRPA